MPEDLKAKLYRWASRRPRHGLARTVFWLAAWFLFVSTLRWLPGTAGGLAAGLQLLLGIVLVMVALPLVWGLIRRHLLWSLRNKLVLTYLLFGLAPLVMLAILAGVTAYIAAGQFAIHLVDARIQAELNDMSAENAVRENQIGPHAEGRQVRETMSEELPGVDIVLPSWMSERRQRLHRNTSCFLDSASIFRGQSNKNTPLGLAPWATSVRRNFFRGIVADNGELYLIALNQHRLHDGRMFTVVDSEPIEGPMAQFLSQGLGVIRLLPPEKQPEESETKPALSPVQQKRSRRIEARLAEIRGGTEPPPVNLADIRVRFLSTLAMTGWEEGKADNLVVEVDSRPSLLYQQLFGASLSGWVMTVLRISLILLTIVFAGIELIAFLMAVRLTRTMTASVSDLYIATQHVDHGDFNHRIQVTRTDQLAELSRSFNNMTGSLQRLLVEQKEKERLQSELSIAQQVQANLFPHTACNLPTLELHGVCRPARSVSGDYYDFLVFQEDLPDAGRGALTRREAGVGIAIGDISGKGISAALLMATLHSAVRAYQFAGEELVYSSSTLEGLTASREGLADAGGWFQSPGRIMSLLNRHLFRSTQPEKYATLFLAHYDAASSVLTYSNAGQLPPFVLGKDGTVQRLEEGGTVVGLIDGMHFAEGRVTMRSGDILIAYSDGVTEPENDFGDFGETRLLEVVNRYRTQPLEVISAQVMLALDAWIGAEEQPDDITLVLARQA